MTAPLPAVRLAQRLATTFPGRVVVKFYRDDGPNWATVIAWNMLSSILPIALALAATAGFALSLVGVQQDFVARVVLDLLPTDASARQQAIAAIAGIQERRGLLAVLALLGFLWIASNLFGAMEAAFDRAFDAPLRPFPLQKLMALALMLIVSVLALLAVGSVLVLPLVAELTDTPALVRSSEGARLIQAALGVTSAFVLYFLIYLVVPNRRMDVRETWPGALFAGVAFELLSLIFPVYIGLQPTINQYGRTFALLFVLLAYFFLLGIITMLGAEVNSVVALERSRRERRLAAADTEEAELAVSAAGAEAPRSG